MCGIVGIVSRPSARPVPSAADVLALLDAAVAAGDDLAAAAGPLGVADALLKGDPGIELLAGDASLAAAVVQRLDAVDAAADAVEARLDAMHGDSAALDAAAARVSAVRDASWAIRRDRLRTADAVLALAGPGVPVHALHGYLSVQQALSAIDRMEVRGRDSAGIAVTVWGADLAAVLSAHADEVSSRSADPLFTSTGIRVAGGNIVFVYKAAAEIGELGDNTRVIRGAVAGDSVLRAALSANGSRVTVLGHTRWASVGIISEPNAHPVNGEETGFESAFTSVAVLNGDVDNHHEIMARHGLHFADPITTDTKVIPSLVDRFRASGTASTEAFRAAVSEFEGNVAIGWTPVDDPGHMHLALHGSGQGCYVGVAEDRFVVASEPYGAVEECPSFVRLDGETPVDPSNPGSRGQIAVLDADSAGSVGGITLLAYDGTALPLGESALTDAGVTTRDIDRGDAPHFLLKEITEAPRSFRKTLRGRVDEVNGSYVPDLDEATFPTSVRARLADGSIRRIRVIGQGTAAVAGTSMVPVLNELLPHSVNVSALTATELSGFGMDTDMSDMLVVAVSQSGTTTDTNRTVDLVAGRGAAVLAIVNRRASDLAGKAHGVYYTSDGRDVEMSVASTKAFYAQVAACAVLGCAMALQFPDAPVARIDRMLRSLVDMPGAMEQVIAMRPEIGAVAAEHAPSRRYWAVVGNGPNTVAANEVRIKLSELCYKSISCDVTEDKKHIDLSCEPMVLVCAAGLGEGTSTDVAKEVAIYKAHKALPVVIASEGAAEFVSAAAVIRVPAVDPTLGFILSAMVGHLFGYDAALAIDALAHPLRRVREVVEHTVERGGSGEEALSAVVTAIGPSARGFLSVLGSGRYDGTLEASSAVRVVTLLRTVMAPDPVGTHQHETGSVTTPSALLDDLVAALTKAIDDLTRPVDAIKHQAKTVTVGISRTEEGLLDRELVRAVVDAGASRDHLSYSTLKVLAALDGAVGSVTGVTRYAVNGDPRRGGATVSIVARTGIAAQLESRVDANPALLGTKRRVADEQVVLVARGRKDGRTVVLVPEVQGDDTVGLTLLHVSFHDTVSAATARQVLQGYDRRYDRLVDWVTETEGSFDENKLSTVSIADLLILPVSESANMWRGGAGK